MNDFKTISENYDLGFITPMEFISQWGAELNAHDIDFGVDLKERIQSILLEANTKMSDIVKEIKESQGWLTKI